MPVVVVVVVVVVPLVVVLVLLVLVLLLPPLPVPLAVLVLLFCTQAGWVLTAGGIGQQAPGRPRRRRLAQTRPAAQSSLTLL